MDDEIWHYYFNSSRLVTRRGIYSAGRHVGENVSVCRHSLDRLTSMIKQNKKGENVSRRSVKHTET